MVPFKVHVYTCTWNFSVFQFSLSLAVPGIILAVVGKYIPTIVLLYVLGIYIHNCR